MTPIRFGPASRELFGIYQQPGSAPAGVVVFCNPFGQEAIRSHRLFKVLADRVCRNGYAVLRFDYYGTGDAAGDDEAVTLEGCIADLHVAHAEALRRSGAQNTAWVGLRLGGTVAAMAASTLPGATPRLVLWEPIVDGAAYLAELAAAQAFAMGEAFGARCLIDDALRALLAREAATEALGFPLSPQLKSDIGVLTPARVADTKASHAKVFCADSATYGEFVAALNAKGVAVESQTVNERIVWTADEMMNSSTVPGEVLQTISNCFPAAS